MAARPQSPAADVLLALSKYDPVVEELREAARRPHEKALGQGADQYGYAEPSAKEAEKKAYESRLGPWRGFACRFQHDFSAQSGLSGIGADGPPYLFAGSTAWG